MYCQFVLAIKIIQFKINVTSYLKQMETMFAIKIRHFIFYQFRLFFRTAANATVIHLSAGCPLGLTHIVYYIKVIRKRAVLCCSVLHHLLDSPFIPA